MKWAYGGQEEILHDIDYASLDWFVDPCWRRVYSHSETGARFKGTINDLITAIDQGHRVRVKVGGKVMEARALRVTTGYVHAQLSDQIGQKGGIGEDKLDLTDEAYWIWSFVDTNGGIYQEHFFYGNNTEAAPASVTTSPVDWFIDTRPWSRLLEVDTTGAVSSGSKTDLQTAIRSGANIRLKIYNNADGIDKYVY
ncbi:disintegrin and metalloproteinase domain-containing protein 10 [Elysia marginata]|uniref:Disintegrin and metalloproteinase domain-containing protein 10 n=1 Tax=Elysia marginata TaxID=1093978 RepID=A0AAV4J0K8_9GAST|nr:disintegrin and metalloproteinase domain-containing protein 10 [Elysia marginata]